MTAETRGPTVVAGGRSPRADIRFNPFSTDFRRDPYPTYRQLREAKPLYKTMGMWVLTRYSDVMSVMRDRSFSVRLIPQLATQQVSRVAKDKGPEVNLERMQTLGDKSLVFTDNPDHARLRALVNRVFTVNGVASIRPRISQLAEQLIERAWHHGGMDAIANFATPLPIMVMCDWMALPLELRECVGPWTHELRGLLEPGLLRAERLAHVSKTLDTFVEALDEVVAERRRRPRGDLISQLAAAETRGGDKLRHEELIFVCIMCFVAGNETTKSLIGNGLLALLQHPSQDARLRREPDLLENFVEEALRYNCPLQMTKRVATRDVQVGEDLIRNRDQVLLCMGAANRDPEVFERPEEFDIARHPNPHLAFGYGMHGCLGGQLATLQAQIAFQRLYARREHLVLLEEKLEWQDHSFIIRCLKELPLAIKGASQ